MEARCKHATRTKMKDRRRYYAKLARDLMDPSGTGAAQRATKPVDTVQAAMKSAARGDRWFYPHPEGTTEASLHGSPGATGSADNKGKGKGKGKPAWQHRCWHLLSAGLEVPNPRPPPASGDGGAGGGGAYSGYGGWHGYSVYGGKRGYDSGRGYGGQGPYVPDPRPPLSWRR